MSENDPAEGQENQEKECSEVLSWESSKYLLHRSLEQKCGGRSCKYGADSVGRGFHPKGARKTLR